MIHAENTNPDPKIGANANFEETKLNRKERKKKQLVG